MPITLCEINIYPIKSTKGISLQSARVERRGLQFDRRWMIVDEAGVFLSQREFPRLALVSARIDGEALLVNAPGMGELFLGATSENNSAINVRVWDDDVKAVTAGEAAKKWFTEFLGAQCQPVFMPEESTRPVKPKYSRDNDIVSFADGYPLLLISRASLADLNLRLATPVPMNRFRPNLVVDGCDAYAEDTWKDIRVGDTIFHVAKPCERCVTTTVDQTTGVAGKEPLATLSRYRNVGGAVLFGQNLLPANLGVLRVGDPVEALSKIM